MSEEKVCEGVYYIQEDPKQFEKRVKELLEEKK